MGSPMSRILLVEDDVDVRLVIEHVLIDAGNQVHPTGTMAAARELLNRHPYELVIADGKLPDGTGMDIADLAAQKGTKALIVTGYAFTLPADTIGRYEILLKPLRPIEIVAAVEQALNEGSAFKRPLAD
jgi:two-component system response regulator HydG